MMNPNTSTNKLQCEQTSIKLICSAETKLDDDEETIVDFPDIDEPEKINPNTNKLECGQTSIKLICSTETKQDDNQETIVDFENATNIIDQFKKPETYKVDAFFKFHSYQPIINIPFNPKKAYKRTDGIHRKWLTFSEAESKLFCSVCIAFCASSDSNPFTLGMNNWKHVYQRIAEHEDTFYHAKSVDAFLYHEHRANIPHMLFSSAREIRRKEVMERHRVLERVIETIKFIGKNSMSYRSHTNESSYTLENNNVSHGNFLEILCLISKFDDILRHHLENVINKSKNRLESNPTITKGRGNLITFISKTTVTYIIQILKSLIQEKIVADIKEAGIYSIQIDSTQDVSVKDQLSIIIRYVTDRVEERLFSMVESHSGKGRNLFELTEKTLFLHELDIANCILDSTDGASNMQGQYAGFTTWLENKSPGHIHTWCYAHVLNLVMKDTSETNVPSISLFGLINKCAVFFRESYRRMDTWVNQLEKCHSKQNSLKRLIKANSTRWWSKNNALNRIFGQYGTSDTALFVDLVHSLYLISSSEKFNKNTRSDALTLLNSLTKFEIIITANIYLKIFQTTTPLSNYLQTSGLDFMQAHRLVRSSIDTLKKNNPDVLKIYMKLLKLLQSLKTEG